MVRARSEPLTEVIYLCCSDIVALAYTYTIDKKLCGFGAFQGDGDGFVFPTVGNLYVARIDGGAYKGMEACEVRGLIGGLWCMSKAIGVSSAWQMDALWHFGGADGFINRRRAEPYAPFTCEIDMLTIGDVLCHGKH